MSFDCILLKKGGIWAYNHVLYTTREAETSLAYINLCLSVRLSATFVDVLLFAFEGKTSVQLTMKLFCLFYKYKVTGYFKLSYLFYEKNGDRSKSCPYSTMDVFYAPFTGNPKHQLWWTSLIVMYTWVRRIKATWNCHIYSETNCSKTNLGGATCKINIFF